jgi:hypothetical protein
MLVAIRKIRKSFVRIAVEFRGSVVPTYELGMPTTGCDASKWFNRTRLYTRGPFVHWSFMIFSVITKDLTRCKMLVYKNQVFILWFLSYIMTLLAGRLSSNRWWIGRDLEESCHGLIEGTIPEFARRNWVKQGKSSVWIAGTPTEIRMEISRIRV